MSSATHGRGARAACGHHCWAAGCDRARVRRRSPPTPAPPPACARLGLTAADQIQSSRSPRSPRKTPSRLQSCTSRAGGGRSARSLTRSRRTDKAPSGYDVAPRAHGDAGRAPAARSMPLSRWAPPSCTWPLSLLGAEPPAGPGAAVCAAHCFDRQTEPDAQTSGAHRARFSSDSEPGEDDSGQRPFLATPPSGFPIRTPPSDSDASENWRLRRRCSQGSSVRGSQAGP